MSTDTKQSAEAVSGVCEVCGREKGRVCKRNGIQPHAPERCEDCWVAGYERLTSALASEKAAVADMQRQVHLALVTEPAGGWAVRMFKRIVKLDRDAQRMEAALASERAKMSALESRAELAESHARTMAHSLEQATAHAVALEADIARLTAERDAEKKRADEAEAQLATERHAHGLTEVERREALSALAALVMVAQDTEMVCCAGYAECSGRWEHSPGCPLTDARALLAKEPTQWLTP